MLDFPDTVSRRPILKTGTVMLFPDDDLVIHPFDDQYAIQIVIVIGGKGGNTDIIAAGPNLSKIIIQNEFTVIGFATNSFLPFVSFDDGKRGLIAVGVRPFGSIHQYVLEVAYTILREI